MVGNETACSSFGEEIRIPGQARDDTEDGLSSRWIGTAQAGIYYKMNTRSLVKPGMTQKMGCHPDGSGLRRQESITK